MRPVRLHGHRLLPALVLSLAAWLVPAAHADGDPATSAVTAQLQSWRDQDQALMGQPDSPATRAERRRLSEAFRAWVRAQGWPLRSMVGASGAQSAWLLVQHADHDPAWQREALDLMEQLLPRDEVNASDLAYLRDRVAMATQGRQRYGTQGACKGPGQWEPFPIEAPDTLDQRRASMGLASMERYEAQASRVLCSKERLAAIAAPVGQTASPAH